MNLQSATFADSKVLLSKVRVWPAAVIRSKAGREERTRTGFVSESRNLPPCAAVTHSENSHDLQCISSRYSKNLELPTFYRKEIIFKK